MLTQLTINVNAEVYTDVYFKLIPSFGLVHFTSIYYTNYFVLLCRWRFSATANEDHKIEFLMRIILTLPYWITYILTRNNIICFIVLFL